MPEFSKKITGGITVRQENIGKIKNASDFEKKVKDSLLKETSELLEIILAGATDLEVSDIHIEPEEEKAKIRLRLDGVLHDILYLDLNIYQNILSRIKLLSGLKLNVSDRPQDGRFSIVRGTEAVEVRASALPAEYGESIVLRILNPKNLISLEDLGLREDLLELVSREITQPNGMIIVTGPTGSGKTTTLYAFLKKIYNPEIKIITIEDPIEYHLKGISQTQTAAAKGYDFASGLKSIVRQDPDVILVGEIRDLETANIALQAALTGHLVLTTLHANDAVGTISRLINLGAKLADLGPAINLVIAQRLVRRVCEKCAKMQKPSAEIISKLKRELRGLPKDVKIPKISAETKTPAAVGCASCSATGFKGRVSIFEAFLINDEAEKFILKNPAAADLKEKAIKLGMVSMKQDGFIKALKGITTLEEVESVVGG